MKKDKFIDTSNEKIISDFKIFSSINSKSDHPLVVDETDETYKIVKAFSDSAQATSEIDKVNNYSNEAIESNNEIVYAEEIIDDDDDIYGDETKDREVEKQRHRTYVDLANELDEKLEINGLHGKIGFNLLSAMKFSRFLYFKNRETLNNEIKTLIRTLDFPFHEVKSSELENIGKDEGMLDFLANAKKNSFKPCFIYVGELEPTNVFDFLKPVYNYIDNPDGDNFFQSNGRNVYIPHNIYILYTIKDHKNYFDIARRLLRYSAIIEGDLIPVEAKLDNKNNKMVLSIDQLKVSFMELESQYEISEDSWRKIDSFVNALNQVNNYKLQNKIVRRLESHMILLLSSGKKESDVVDICLANDFMSEAIISKTPAKYFDEFSLIEMVEENFDPYPMSKCKEVIASYLSLFDKKGERLEDAQ